MWILGLVLGVISIVLAGAANGLMNRIILSSETAPKWMGHPFWNFEDTCGSSKLLAFTGIVNGYKLTEFTHWLFLAIGSMLFSISVFFYASSVTNFIIIHFLILFCIYILRRLGQYLTFK